MKKLLIMFDDGARCLDGHKSTVTVSLLHHGFIIAKGPPLQGGVGRGQPCLNLSAVQLSLGRMNNTEYIQDK
jgi:hypothetical protein